MEWGIKMNTSDWINVIGIIVTAIGIIVSIVEIVLWVIDYFRGMIKKKRDDLDKKLEARPKWLLKRFPFIIVENSDKHYFKKVYLYIFTESNAEVRVINREKGTNKIMLNFNNVTLKKGVTVRVIIIESTTDRGKKAYYLYGDGVRGQIVSESNPTLIKYLKIKDKVELFDHNRANEITTTTTTTTVAPGYYN